MNLGTDISVSANIDMSQEDWNNSAVEDYKEKGETADSTTLYAASKVLSERYLLDLTRDHGEELTWDVTNILPCWVS